MKDIAITRSNKWKYKLSIKHLFQDETTNDLIIILCDSLIRQLTKVSNNVVNSNLNEDVVYRISDELDLNIDNFRFLIELADGSIRKQDWLKYEFAGDFQSRFNEYMSMLYDLADERVLTKQNVSEKFIWVG